MDATILGAWMATGLTLFIFSFLYQDNPLFKLAEHLYVGVSVGYTIVKAYDTVIVHMIVKPIVEQGEIALLIPVAIGLLMLTRYVPRAAWMSRYAFAFIVGLGSRARDSSHDFLIHPQAGRGYGTAIVVSSRGGRPDLFAESPQSREQPECGDHLDRGQHGPLLLFLLHRTQRSGQGCGEDRDCLSDDRVRRGIRLHGDGTHVALDRPTDRPHRIL